MKPLLAPDIIAHARIMQDGETATGSYFRLDSKCFRAIQRHIARADDCVIIDRESRNICSSSAHGPAINYEEMTVFSTQFKGNTPYEVDFFEIKISVDYENEDYGSTVERTYRIKIPIDLELNFTQEKFDAWISKLAQEKKARRENSDRAAFDAMLAKYPEWK